MNSPKLKMINEARPVVSSGWHVGERVEQELLNMLNSGIAALWNWRSFADYPKIRP